MATQVRINSPAPPHHRFIDRWTCSRAPWSRRLRYPNPHGWAKDAARLHLLEYTRAALETLCRGHPRHFVSTACELTMLEFGPWQRATGFSPGEVGRELKWQLMQVKGRATRAIFVASDVIDRRTSRKETGFQNARTAAMTPWTPGIMSRATRHQRRQSELWPCLEPLSSDAGRDRDARASEWER